MGDFSFSNQQNIFRSRAVPDFLSAGKKGILLLAGRDDTRTQVSNRGSINDVLHGCLH
jgi:hypothetical protein